MASGGQGRHADFWQVTGDALDFSLELLRLDRPGLRDRLMNLFLTPSPPAARPVDDVLDVGDVPSATPRRADATPPRSMMPAARMLATMGHVLATKASASTDWTSRPIAAASRALVGFPSLAP
jgi:hypothetical protein